MAHQRPSGFPPAPPSCSRRFPLPPNFPLLNHIREKSRCRMMANTHYEFVGEIPRDVLCGICLLVPHDPQRVTCCGRYFCYPCISEWMATQCGQCPLCFRPNTSHVSDQSLSQRILLFPVYCSLRQKGCNWQGMLRDLELHLSSDEGCQFTMVDCPLTVFGCQLHAVQRRELHRHMADKHTKHMTTVIGQLKQTSSRLESQQRQMEDLQQRFLLFSSQINSTLQAQSGLGAKTNEQELLRLKSRLSQLEHILDLTKPQQHHPNLSLLDQALSDTFPRLCERRRRESYTEREGEGEEGEEVVGLNTSLLQGLRRIEEEEREKSGRMGVSQVVTGGEEEAGLPNSGDLPTEQAGGDIEEATVQDEKSPIPSPTVLPSYAIAVTKPFHLVLHGSDPSSHATPLTQQSSLPHLPGTTSTTKTVTNPITTATVVMENQEDGVIFANNSQASPFEFLGGTATESDYSIGRQRGLSQNQELIIPSGDFVLKEVVRALPRCGSVGWSTPEWMGESGGVTPRSDSSLSLRSSSSNDSSFTGDTVIQYGSSTVIVSTTSGKKSPSPDHTQVKLFVKYMPHCCSPEKAVSLFLVHGQVHLLEYHSEHRDKLFLIMDREGGLQAMKALNGTRLPGSPKPLSVQLYRSVPVSTTPIVQRADSITTDKTLRLFVKNIKSDSTTEEIRDLFSGHGQVFDVQKHPTRRSVAFVYMSEEGGKKAIASLHGYNSHHTSKPLVVELSHEPTGPVSSLKV